ncbi:MAG: ribosomal protein S18-alanine N-acetyltransferase [Magnetococcales bacterium]|nr:ribosomal protein S18-alanine N-acetyltransferase [Magnetococcales bacterium]MBF0156841.1 ribosomal protein S18-alanine N-acetyltransferase [Magnetococcales bacterium]
MIRLRPMLVTDTTACADLDREITAKPWSAAMFAEELELGSLCLIAEPDDHSLAGMAIARPQLDEWHLLTIGVRPEWQRQGVGRRLLAAVIRRAETTDFRSVMLEVRISNKAALHLYQAMGFQPLYRRPRYYRGPDGWEDAWVMDFRTGKKSTLRAGAMAPEA